MFKNLCLFKIVQLIPMDNLAETLESARFLPCGASQEKSVGWEPPRGGQHDEFAPAVDGHTILKLTTEVKSVPADALRREVDEKAAEIEATNGRKIGKKERRALADDARLAMLPMAFAKRSITKAERSLPPHLLKAEHDPTRSPSPAPHRAGVYCAVPALLTPGQSGICFHPFAVGCQCPPRFDQTITTTGAFPVNTLHRAQSHQKRNSIQDLELPKWWRPKLEPDAQFQAKLTHWDLISRFTDGSANAEDLWDWMETGFTYSQMMRLLTEEEAIPFTDEALTAITEQLLSYEGVAARFTRTGRVGFNSQELLTARAAASIMDGLIEMDRHGIATRAALWSKQEMVKVRAAHAKALNGTARRMLEQSRRAVA